MARDNNNLIYNLIFNNIKEIFLLSNSVLIILIVLTIRRIKEKRYLRTCVLPSIHVVDITKSGVRFFPAAHFHDLLGVARMGREVCHL